MIMMVGMGWMGMEGFVSFSDGSLSLFSIDFLLFGSGWQSCKGIFLCQTN